MIHPEVTLYGWQNVKILELANFFSAFCRTLLFSQPLFGACSADCFLEHVLQMWQCDFTHNHKQVVNRLKNPRVSPHHCFTGGVKFLQGEESVVIHCKKIYLLYKDTTCLCSLSAAFSSFLLDPNTKRFKQMLIYFNMDIQMQIFGKIFREIPFYQATKWHLNNR